MNIKIINMKGYYGDNIKNITLLHGKNGAGKSTLLDLLGMRLDDRRRNSHRKENRRSYFLMYHLYDNYYGFEFSDSSYIEGDQKITNINMHGIEVRQSLYKPWVSLIFSLEDNKLVYKNNFFKRWMEENGERAETRYAYITEDKYNSRINSNFVSEDDGEYIFARKYYINGICYEYLYKYLIYMKNKDEFWRLNKNIDIINIIKDELSVFRNEIDDETEEYLDEKIDELDKILKDSLNLDEENIKAEFISRFYIELIEYYFLNRFSGWIWNREPESRGIDILQEKYEKLVSRIETMSEDEECFDEILNYVLNKVDTEARRTVQTNEQMAISEMLNVIKELPEKYFKTNRKIRIDCNEPIEEKVSNLLRVYDFIYRGKDNEGSINTIDNVLGIIVPEMSEGQRVFLDIISKVTLAVDEIENGDNIVLLIDEPDRAIHPELARNFIDILLRNLNECQERTIQVVLSSHSPFIVTDILPENVYAITKEESNNKSIIKQKQDTFATNIYYLLMDTFMLENTFGKYSYDKIKDVIKRLKYDEIEEQELNSIKDFIDRIGEKTVRKKLLELYYAKDRRYVEKQKISQEILHIDDEEKLRKIKRILDE
ncbi:AAA family ATPase [Anaerostipes hadrus]|uniref:AAA family ATPase n=1 Tax=Anaerostipes hadrus TaxID=649756 RepID=UPI0035670D42